MENPSNQPLGGRLALVLLGGVAALALAGYLVGIRQIAPQPGRSGVRSKARGAAPRALTYAGLRQRRARPGQAAEIRQLGGGSGLRPRPGKPTPREHRLALRARARRRAFAGAPPVIPHGADPRSSGACLSCHGQGALVEGKVARPVPHPAFGSCTQCHVASHVAGPGPVWAAVNTFRGIRTRGKSTRAGVGAPPTMPHPAWMRGRCLSCHGPAGQPGLRTSHPQRRSCLQCHAQPTTTSPSGLPR